MAVWGIRLQRNIYRHDFACNDFAHRHFLFKCEHPVPIVFHADHGPAASFGAIE
jgi:hypothetical protein